MKKNVQQGMTECDGKTTGVFRTKWPKREWHELVEKIAPITFRIYAGNSCGTCFAISVPSKTEDRNYSAIFVTAWHVIQSAVEKGEDTKLVSADQSEVFDTKIDQMHYQQLGNVEHDTVMIMLKSKKKIVEKDDLAPILPFHTRLKQGAEIAWMGFPGLVEPQLCFFQGHVSGFLNTPPVYLIDGVAINGVSGGPAFDECGNLVGLVSAYLPNKLKSGATLPGLAILTPISAIRLFMERVMKAEVH